MSWPQKIEVQVETALGGQDQALIVCLDWETGRIGGKNWTTKIGRNDK